MTTVSRPHELFFLLSIKSVSRVCVRPERCVLANAAFNVTERPTINHVNDRRGQRDGFGSGLVHMEEVGERWRRGPGGSYLISGS